MEKRSVLESLERVQTLARLQSRALDCMSFFTELCMANMNDVLAALADLKEASDADEAAEETSRARDAAQIAADNAKIADLEAQLANAQPQDLQPILDQIAAIKAGISTPADPTIPPGETPVG